MEQSTSLNIFDQNGVSVAEVELSPQWFSFKPNPHVVHDYVVSYLKNQRHWSASTKTRAEVSGTGKKPFRQKGTGRARAGSLVSPLFKGGGVTFGPRPKDVRTVRTLMPKKVKRLALKSVLCQRIKEGSVRIIDDIKLEAPRTKAMVEMLGKLNVTSKVLVIMGKPNENLRLSMRNIPKITCRRVDSLNAYDLVAHPTLIFTRDSIGRLGLIEENQKDRPE